MVAFTQDPQELNLPGLVVITRTQGPLAPMYRVSDGPVIPVMALTRTQESQALSLPSLRCPGVPMGACYADPRTHMAFTMTPESHGPRLPGLSRPKDPQDDHA